METKNEENNTNKNVWCNNILFPAFPQFYIRDTRKRRKRSGSRTRQVHVHLQFKVEDSLSSLAGLYLTTLCETSLNYTVAIITCISSN